MKKENIMLSLLIPGPQQPGNSIDIYLEPLIEDLIHLWNNGETTYDAFSKTTFNLKALLLWTISDFPTYGNLAGCKKKGRILSGHEISKNLKNFKNDFGNLKRSARKRKRTECTGLGSDNDESSSESDEDEEDEVKLDEDELSRWKKRSIFFKLPYWEDLPVRHNLDVMHVERNVAASIVSTLLHCGKSKDGLNARKDLEVLGIRKDLHPRTKGKRTYLPPAPWSLSKAEKKIFCTRLVDFKGPDGYCSNIARGVSIKDCKVTGLKSHDYHVLIQQLLPIALKGLSPKGLRLAILRLCAFYNLLCQRVIDREQILVMEAEIVETICMFERFFPPSFFDIMVHLTVHLGRETRLGGPVHFRWMYPFERYMKVLKDFVRNPARPEGNGYENSSSCCHPEYGCSGTLCRHLQDSNGRCRRDASMLWRMHTDKFASWLKQQIPLDSDSHGKILKWLAYGPRCIARSYTGYIVNGQRFHTMSVDRKNHNSGVYYEATAICRASAKDISQVVDLVSYYGRVVDIILLEYNVFYVPLFRCNWAVMGNEVKIEDGFTLVNMSQSQVSFLREPYILASQAKQVFYLREDAESSWHVVMRGPSRRYKNDLDDGIGEIGPLPSNVDMDIHMDESENARTDCEGIYV
ncbi:uncharacterized protein LOC112086578 [Eutrema salsugineum]|uniref:uncharacterized protein LOC112086578 n=1 Tax=Eutrema salsugineum TaxID=72664 RepID=UPI000CECEF0E|nr:uncharacterized protein LOC112086578 [Eutrema salsugineum]